MNSYPIPLTLHIGYPRTATTLLQKQLYKSNKNILYLGRKRSNTPSERWLNKKLYIYWEWIRSGKIEIDIEDARKQINTMLAIGAENNKEAAVISDETISKPHRIGHSVKISQRLNKLFPNAKILLTIRNQIDLIFSLYGLALRRSIANRSSLPTFDSWFMEGAGSNYVPIQERFNYANLYSDLLNNYNGDKISVLFYEDFINNNNKYMADLKEAIGVRKLILNTSSIINASPTMAEDSPLGRYMIAKSERLYDVRFIRRYPKLLDLYYKKILRRRVNWDDYKINDDRKRIIMSLFYKSNDYFAELADINLNNYGYPTSTKMQLDYTFFDQK